MRILRIILIWLCIAAALAALLVLTAISPPLQTWAGQAALNRQPGVHASVDSLSAGFGRVDIEKAHIEFNGAVLTLPLLQAQVPLTRALLERKVSVQGLLAKGWTLDLSKAGALHAEDAKPANEAATPSENQASATRASLLLLGYVTTVKLPFGVSLEGVDMEGDVILPGGPGKGTTQVHVTVSGGHDGQFAFDASTEATGTAVSSAFAHGTITLLMRTPRTLDVLKLAAEVTMIGEAQSNLAVSVQASAEHGPGGETYSLSLSRGGRRAVVFDATSSQATGGVSGTWKANLVESDLAPFSPFTTLPTLAAVGEGSFEADSGLSRMHAVGRLKSAAGSLSFLAPILERVGKANVDVDFDATLSGRSLHVGHLMLSLEGARSTVVVQSLQTFDFDGNTGSVVVPKPGEDFFEGSVKGLPLEWLSSPTSRLRFTAGEANARFVIRPHDGGFSLRLKEPLTASGVSVAGLAGAPLDLSAPLLASYAPTGWDVTVGPLSVRAAGRFLGEIQAKASRVAGADPTVAVTGTWSAALEALAFEAGVAGPGWQVGKSASGDFSAKLGDTTGIDGKVIWAGQDPSQTVSATVHLDVDADGDFAFTAPIDFASNGGKRELSTEGSCAFGRSGGELEIRLTSEDIAEGDLRLLAAPLAAAGGGRISAASKVPGPFWGGWTGNIGFSFKLLRTPNGNYDEVGGALVLKHDQVRLETGRVWILNHNLGKFEGTISFDPSLARPYAIKASGSVEDVDAAAFFGTAPKGQSAPFEGHFSAAATLTGVGVSLDELARDAHPQILLKSQSGILRFLKVDVADAVPEASTPVSDTLGDVSSAVGSIFGIHKGFDRIDRNKVSPAADAIINFTYEIAEIGYDRLTIAAAAGPDQALHLSDIEMDFPDERLRGSGDIAFGKGAALPKRPLSLDLVLSVKGHPAELLSKAGILVPKKDDAGFRDVTVHVVLGGTLEQVDTGPWHDALAKVVAANPLQKKKDN